MPDEKVKAEITARPIAAKPEEVFVPGAVPVEKVELVLKPIVPPEAFIETYPEFLPPGITYKPTTSPTTIPMRSLCWNIETTGINPWESRLIVIGVRDLTQPGSDYIHFYDENEETQVRNFVDWYRNNGFNELVGYNESFDFRFIFALCCRYGIQAPELFYSSLDDMANVMKQVKRSYVFGFNKPGKLDQWAEYLFGMKPPITQAQVFEAWKKKDIDAIVEFNKYKVDVTEGLWNVTRFAFAI